MVARKKDLIFEDKDPQDFLLSQLFGKLSREDKLKFLEQAIIKRANHKSVIDLLDKIEKFFDRNGAEYRTFLRKLFWKLPKKYNLRGRSKSSTEMAPAAQNLKLEMLKRILSGWKWNKGFSYDQVNEETEESEVCFRFICLVYNCVERTKYYTTQDFPRNICKVFREGLSVRWGQAYELDQWILREPETIHYGGFSIIDIVPTEFKEMMIKARTRFGQMRIIGEEVKFLEPFDLHKRSNKAKELIMEKMKRIREMEELITEFIVKLKIDFGFVEHGSYNIENGVVAFKLESAKAARITVNVCSSYKYRHEDCPKLTLKLQKARDDFVFINGGNIEIKLSILGPQEYKFEE